MTGGRGGRSGSRPVSEPGGPKVGPGSDPARYRRRGWPAPAVGATALAAVAEQRGQARQVSLSVTVPEAGTVAVRLAPDSQVTVPAASLRMYLYSNVVPAARATSSFQTG